VVRSHTSAIGLTSVPAKTQVLRVVLRELVSEKIVQRAGAGTRGKPYLYFIDDSGTHPIKDDPGEQKDSISTSKSSSLGINPRPRLLIVSPDNARESGLNHVNGNNSSQIEAFQSGGNSPPQDRKRSKNLTNKKLQQRLLFGTVSRPGRYSEHSFNQMQVAKKFLRRFALGLEPGTGKFDQHGNLYAHYQGLKVNNLFTREGFENEVAASKSREHRAHDPKATWIEKDRLRSQMNADAVIHEISHFLKAPFGMDIPTYQKQMDLGWGRGPGPSIGKPNSPQTGIAR
jgi:hypothetical protein